MSQEPSDVKAVLEDLINQFSDPHAFFRELIQNSIDAGSSEVEISFDFENPTGDETEGTLTIHVNDFGEGMNREIIETRLTRLFSSTKDDDLTKIGRFGIGFVSVYAIEPDAIAVDTARGGECWRVVFKPDRSYELYSVPDPVEGTRIRIFKRMTYAASQLFVRRAEDEIARWCAYVKVPVFVSGKDIRRPFDVEAPIKFEFNEPGTRIIAGLVGQKDAIFGFYNQGLTLVEGTTSAWPGLTFRIDSRYLEHTLTRDRVLEDKNFHKAKGLIDRIYREDLPALLLKRMEELAKTGGGKEYHDLFYVFEMLIGARPDFVAKNLDRKLFIDKNGPTSLRSLRAPAIYVLGPAKHLGQFVPNYVHGADPASLVDAIDACGFRSAYLSDSIIVPREKAELKPHFKNAILSLAERLDFRVKDVFWGDFVYEDSPINFESVFYLLEGEHYVFAEALREREGTHPSRYSVFYLNSREQFWKDLELLSESQPAFAAMTLIKSLLLPIGMSSAEEDRLMRASLET